MKTEELVIDCDGHILEPPDLWEKYIDPKYRDRAMRIRVGDRKGNTDHLRDGLVGAFAHRVDRSTVVKIFPLDKALQDALATE